MVQVVLLSGTSWTVPADWTATNTFETIGGGAGGASVAGCPGGGGGAWSKITNKTGLSGAQTIAIGAAGAGSVATNTGTAGGTGGDTWIGASTLAASYCGAKGGAASSTAAGGLGGATASGIGTTKFAGGAGGDGTNTAAGGGGAGGPGGAGAAGAASNTDGSGNTGGSSGGGGASGGTTPATPTNALGGAGGTGPSSSAGGTGGTLATPAGGIGAAGAGGGGGYGTGAVAGTTAGAGGAGGAGTDSAGGGVGAGGGGGGGGQQAGTSTTNVGGAGGNYGGGGGGPGFSTAAANQIQAGGAGAKGAIIITYVSSTQAITGTGIGSTSGVGVPTTAVSTVSINPTAIAPASAPGTPSVSWAQPITASGVASAAALGTPSYSVSGGAITANGIAPASGVGSPGITLLGSILPTGIASTAAPGAPTQTFGVAPAGIAPASGTGAPAFSELATIGETGIASTAGAGAPSFAVGPVSRTAVGIASTAAFGLPGVSAVSQESPDGTIVTSVGPIITDSGGAKWAITSGAQVSKNGVTDASTSGVVELAYVSHTLYQKNNAGNWYSWNGTGWTGPVANPLGVQAARAFQFTDSVGINTHLNEGSPGWSSNTVVAASLAYAKITHIRDGFVESDTLSAMQTIRASVPTLDLLANTLHYTGAVGGFALSNFITNAASMETTVPGIIAGLEGPNEVDVASFSYAGKTGSAAGNQQQIDLWNAAKGNAKLSAKPIVMWGLANQNNAASAGSSASAFCNFGNVHDYTFGGLGGSISSYDQSFITGANTMSASKPIWSTECGFFTNLADASNWGIDEPTQGKLLLNTLLVHFNEGFQRTYIYELMNTDTLNGSGDSQSNYGIFHSDGSAKSAATYIRNLQTYLADAGATAKTFTPGSLNFTLTGMPAGGNSVLLQKSSGNYELVLYNDVSLWDTSTKTARSIAASNVNVAFNQAYPTVRVLDPVTNTTVQSASNVSSLNVALSDHPVIVEIVPPTGSTINLNPTGIGPTSGPGSPGLLSAKFTIVLNNPGTQTVGIQFTVNGNISGYATPPTLELSTDGGASWQAFPPDAQVTTSTFSFTRTNGNTGLHDYYVRDANNTSVVSNLAEYNVLPASANQTATPSGLASVSGPGTPLVVAAGAPQTIGPVGIASTAHLGTEITQGFPAPQSITLKAVAPTSAVGVPNAGTGVLSIQTLATVLSEFFVQQNAPLAQNLSPNGIPSLFGGPGLPSVVQPGPQAITPTGAAPTSGTGLPGIFGANVLSLLPSGVPSGSVVGAPAAALAITQGINPTGIASTATVGLETVGSRAPSIIAPFGFSTTLFGFPTVTPAPNQTITPRGIAPTFAAGALTTGDGFIRAAPPPDLIHAWRIAARRRARELDEARAVEDAIAAEMAAAKAEMASREYAAIQDAIARLEAAQAVAEHQQLVAEKAGRAAKLARQLEAARRQAQEMQDEEDLELIV